MPPLILNVASLGNGKFVTVTEDGCAYLWDTAEVSMMMQQQQSNPQVTKPKQQIIHPKTVWNVVALSNGDFATACHDGCTRIFTTDPTRIASMEELNVFQTAVTDAITKQAQQSGPTAEEVAKLPDWNTSRHAMIGKSEGQVQLFQKDGKAIAAQWSTASRTWIEVGEVTGTSANRGTINGVAYDHVFPLEVDQPGGGLQNLQIGYNNGDNPFVVAQQFIDEHQLDQHYLAQIADYIRQRAGETAPMIGSVSNAGGGGASGGRGSVSSSSPMITTPADETPYEHLPMKSYLIFESGAEKGPMSKIVSKIREINCDGNLEASKKLNSQQVEGSLDSLSATLCATNRYHATFVSSAELNVIKAMISKWPLDYVFPALDLARLMVLHPDASGSKNATFWEEGEKFVSQCPWLSL